MPDIKNRENLLKNVQFFANRMSYFIFTALLIATATSVSCAQSDTEDAKWFIDALKLKKAPL